MEHFFSILGGMGTMATESFVHLLNERVVTHKDQDYLNYVLFNHATVPDRTAYILDATNDSPLPYLLDDIEKHNRFWASGKIYGYTKAIKEFEPFVHFDNDAGFHVKPPEFTDELTVQHIHNEYGSTFGNIFGGLVNRIVKETPNEFPYDIYHEAVKDDLRGCNCGVIFFNDSDVWSEFSRYTWALQNSEFFDKIASEAIAPMYKHFNYWNVVIEEILLYSIFKRLKKKEPNKLFDINGFDFPKETPNPLKYFHIWGSKRDREFLKIREKIAVDYLDRYDKALVDRIYTFFNRKRT